MPVSLPTAAEVRKVREQATQNVSEQAEQARTPLLAALGVSDYAVSTVTKVVTGARTRATERAEVVQTRVTELPHRLTPAEVRRAVADLREQAEQTYGSFAERGEQAWGRIRRQPQVSHAIATIESFTEKLDARVDHFVDDAHDAAQKAMAAVTRQTRSAGEKAARSTQKFAADAAEVVAEVADDASEKVARAGAEVAENITEAGDEVAHDTRSTTRKVANRTAPTSAPKATANHKPAARRTNRS